MIKSGQIIQIRRGLFIDSNREEISPRALAPILYGPSYLSFQYALSVYGIIPERVTTFTSASFRKNKNKMFHTPLGDYSYQYLPARVYPYGIHREEEQGYPYLLASPEKALCDSLYKVSGITTPRELEALLVEQWRIERSDILNLERACIRIIAPLYRRRSVMTLLAWFDSERTHA